MDTNKLLAVLESKLQSNEESIVANCFKMDWESDEEYQNKTQRRVRLASVCIRASELEGINELINRHGELVENGLFITRKCVDEIDNIWVSRAR